MTELHPTLLQIGSLRGPRDQGLGTGARFGAALGAIGDIDRSVGDIYRCVGYIDRSVWDEEGSVGDIDRSPGYFDRSAGDID